MDLFDVEVVERIESELDSFIEKRAREARDAEKVEELWAESARADRERRREAHRQQWCEYERHLERVHMDLALEHRAKAAELAARRV